MGEKEKKYFKHGKDGEAKQYLKCNEMRMKEIDDASRDQSLYIKEMS